MGRTGGREAISGMEEWDSGVCMDPVGMGGTTRSLWKQ